MKKLFLITSILIFQYSNAQIDPNSLLVLNAGTTAEINAITPDAGAMVYNTDDNKTYVFTGVSWTLASGANENWTISGNNQYSAVSGNVGIGVNNPTEKLEVNGTIQFGNTGATTGVVHMLGKYSGINHINTYGSERSSGATVIGYAVQPKLGAAGYVSSAQNVAFARGLLRTTGDFQFLAASSALVNVGTDVTLTPRFTIKNGGNVGIGIINPGAKLEVAGQVKITGGNPGAGKILTSNASGLATWQAPSSGTDSDWTISGNNQYSAVSGNVGIGTSSPAYRLDVREQSTTAGIGTQEAISVSSTVAANATSSYGIYANTTPTATGNVTNNYSVFGDVNMPAGATANNTYGIYGRSLIAGTVTANSYGVLGTADVLSSGSVTSTIRGGHFAARVRSGGSVAVAYGVLSSAQHEGNLSGANYGTYSIARPLPGSTVNSNFGTYNNASIPAGATVNTTNYASLNNADIFGTVTSNNFASYNIARLRNGVTLGASNYGVYAHTGHINGTVTGSNFGVYSYSPGDANSTVGTNYAGYFNADHTGNVDNNNFGLYVVSRTRNGGSIGGSNYAGYFYGAASNSGGGGYGTIAGNNFGLRVVMSSQGVGNGTYGIYQTGDAGTENYFQSTVGINTTSGAGVLNVNGVATKTGGGVWTVFSDFRSKENINSYTKGLKELLQLRPVSFNYKKSFGFGTETHVGFIAQEVEKIVPTMVTEADMHGLKDFKQVDTNEVTFMLINAIKELQTENKTLKTENKSMKNRIEAIEEIVQKLQQK